jgi:dTDP-4-dehydrorhamnose reductase
VNREDLDLTEPGAIRPWLDATRPELVINCAAYTAVDKAEDEKDAARQVNAIAVGRLAEFSAENDIRFVTFSTDYVFDGSKIGGYVESDTPNPQNAYGATKLEGELLVTRANPRALVVRTSWVLSGTHRNFASTMLDLLGKGPVRVVDDQHGRPTLVDDLAVATMEAVGAGASGVLHLTNQGETTWFGLAQEVAEIAGLDPGLVEPISTAQFPRPAKRPANSLLDSERLAGLGLKPLPHYRPSLENAVEKLRTLTL